MRYAGIAPANVLPHLLYPLSGYINPCQSILCQLHYVLHTPLPDLHMCTSYRSFIPVLPRTSRPAAPHATYDQYVHGPPQATSHGGTYTLSPLLNW